MEQLRYKIVDECDLLGSISSSESESEISSGSSLESDSFEEITSLAASSSPLANDHQLGVGGDPLNDMSSLFQQLPIKRGLSKYYQGKAQSFTSLAKVNSLEDLAKPENPYNKKMKSCRSYVWKMDEIHENHRARCTPSAISKHVSQSGLTRGSCSSLRAERGSDNFMGSRTQIQPHRSTSTNTIPNQTALFV